MNDSSTNNNQFINEKEAELNFKKMMVQIDKMIEESFKTKKESERIHLLMLEEQAKTRAETQKLNAETAKIQKEEKFYLYVVMAGLLGAIFIKLVDKLF